MKTHGRSYIVAIAAALSGLITLFSSFKRHAPFRIDFDLDPIISLHTSRAISLMIGFLLLYISLQLIKHKRTAWYMVVSMLVLLLLLEFVGRTSVVACLLYGITLSLLVLDRKFYTVRQSNLSLRRGLFVASLLAVVAIAYGLVGFWLLNRHDIGVELGLQDSIRATLQQLFTFQDVALVPHTRHAAWFLDSLNLAGFMVVGFTVVSLFKPLYFTVTTRSDDIATAKLILEKYSTSTEDFFKLWPADKHYFFNKNRTAFIAYKVSRGSALVVDGPSGPRNLLSNLLNEFTDFALSNGWLPAIIHGDQKLEKITSRGGYGQVFIGNEAMVAMDVFNETTATSKHFRYVKNKSRREELVFEYWSAPLSDMQIAGLRSVSDAWKAHGNRREYTFIMGYFDDVYMRNSDIAVVVKEGAPIAYTNIIPSFSKTSRSIDHMRYVPEASGTVMHYLLMELFYKMHGDGIKYCNLGLSPLSGIEDEAKTTPERLLKVLKKVGARYYSFSGLEQFKNKFRPTWEPRYIYYYGLPSALLPITNSLSKAVSVPIVYRLRRQLLGLLGLAAGITYVSFLMVYILRLNMTDLISELAVPGRPYAWLFTLSDVVSGILMIAISCIALTLPKVRERRLLKVSVFVFALGGLGNALAALAPLPGAGFSSGSELYHTMFSALSFAGLLISAGLAMRYAYVTKLSYRLALAILLVIILVTGAVSLCNVEPIAGIFAQLFIGLIGIWIVLFGIVLSRIK